VLQDPSKIKGWSLNNVKVKSAGILGTKRGLKGTAKPF
jgi:hypothetical protein